MDEYSAKAVRYTASTLYASARSVVATRAVTRQNGAEHMSVTNGVRLPVGMAAVFPAGCHLVPGSITEAQDWDEATRSALQLSTR